MSSGKKTAKRLEAEIASAMGGGSLSPRVVGYRMIYLAAGKRSMSPEEFSSVEDAARAVRFMKARGMTAWAEDDSGTFVPIKGTMRRPAAR